MVHLAAKDADILLRDQKLSLYSPQSQKTKLQVNDSVANRQLFDEKFTASTS